MNDILELLILVVFVLFIMLSLQYYKQRWPVRNFPPGPTGLPLVGTGLSTGIVWTINSSTKKFQHRYGNVFSLMQDVPLVVVNGREAIREVLYGNKGYDFANRYGTLYSNERFNPKMIGLFSANFSDEWQKRSRFVLSSLRGFGFGQIGYEGKIMREVKALLSHIKSLAKVPQDLSVPLKMSIANIMCDTLLGCRYNHNDKEFQNLIHVIERWFVIIGAPETMVMDFVPITRPFLQKNVAQLRAVANEFHDFVKSKVAEHQNTLVSGKEPLDFVDCYLVQMAEEPDIFTLEELNTILTDLFTGGMDTTAQTLKFSLLYMMVHPHVQNKVYKELMQVVGPSRLPCLEDRDRLPYTVATICETQRLASVAPVFPRCASVDTTLAGYSIPKGTRVMCDVMELHHDPELWAEPDRFDPTRHLDEEGNLVKSRYLLPFGGGRRGCMGETLARMELFLFFSSSMHQFKLEIPLGLDVPSLDRQPGFNASPKPFQVMISER